MSRATATTLTNDKGVRTICTGPLLERMAGTCYKNILNISNQRQIDEVNVADNTLAGSIR